MCTLPLLACERYYMVCKPMAGFRMTVRLSCQGLLGVWLFGLFWAVPPLLGWSSYGPEGVQTSCSLGWEERWNNRPELQYLSCEMRDVVPVEQRYGNRTVREEYIGLAFTVTNCVVLLFTAIVGIAANAFVMWAVYHQKSLRTWNNALLVNLAVVDVLRCCVDCPVLLKIVLKEAVGGRVGELVCDAQVASFSMSCCLQLLTLACIGAERHEAIAHPFKFVQRKTRILIWIPSTWIVGFTVSIFCFIFVKDSPVYVRCRGLRADELLSYDTFGVYILIPLWSLCFLAITVFYTHIFFIVRGHSRKVFDASQELHTGNKTTGTAQPVDGKDGKTKHNDSPKKEISKKVDADQRVNTQGEPVERAAFKQDETEQLGTDGGARPTCLTNQEHGARGRSPENTPEIKTQEFSTVVPVERSRNYTEGESMSPTHNLDEARRDFSDNPSESTYLTGKTMTEPVYNTAEKPLNNVEQPGDHLTPQVNIPKLEHLERDKDSLPPVSDGDCDVKAEDIGPSPNTSVESGAVILIPGADDFSADQSIKTGRVQDLTILSVSVAGLTSVTNPITYAAVNPQFRTQFYYLRRKCKSLWT
ncbi:hypothetical protein DPEC_G00160810 [Dallia pectoralis]|uniref:Uncharacterized protein n=1 Tax=Dallia pectoralis TaxID=75939 RepID=A0ACC2GFW1_DALPE|nr:hypothetical protein DPEC_G00160810 [Dallia pectoralis]